MQKSKFNIIFYKFFLNFFIILHFKIFTIFLNIFLEYFNNNINTLIY